jgi:hypothetical protein
VTPATQDQHGFKLTFDKDDRGVLRIEGPAEAGRGPLRQIRLVVRRPGNDNFSVPVVGAVWKHFEEGPDGRRAARFSVAPDYLAVTGVVFSYGSSTLERETAYSFDLADWAPK